MAIVRRTLFLALVLAASLAAAAEDPQPAIIEGTVINLQNSRTIPRATVTLLRARQHGSSTRTDGNGHFIFKNVEPGTYRLMAERQGYFSDARKREYQPMFDVAAGEHVKNVAVRLMPAAIVSGEIMDEYNDPVQNVEIKLLAIQMRLGQMFLRAAGTSRTDDRGQYRISGLHPGKYYLVAEYKSGSAAGNAAKAQALVQSTTQANPANRSNRVSDVEQEVQPDVPDPAYTYAPLFYPATGDFQQAQTLGLNPGDELAANFLLVSAPVVSIRGKVTNGITGGQPTGAAVSAFWTIYMEGEGLPARVSPEDGTFEIRNLAPGTYTLRANFTEDGQTYAGERTVQVGNNGAENIEIPALPDFVGAGHVSIAANPPPKDPLRRVLIEFAGEGLMPRIRATANFPQFNFEAQLRPDHRYRAQVRNLPEDYYLKSVALSGHEMPPDNVTVSGLRGDIEFVLSPAGGHIEGVLVDAQGEPTHGSVLLVPDIPQLGPPDLFRRTSANSQGKFTFRGVAPGSYRVVAMESLNLEAEINDPDFFRSIGNRGDSLKVEESGQYIIHLRLDLNESR